jgi:thioredoxin 1
MPRKIDQKNFKNEVIESMELAIVQFKSEWSGACQIIAPLYEELAKHYKGSANFFVSDIEVNTSLEKEFGIQEVPTILFFKHGEIIDFSIGLISKNTLIAKIENALTD